MIYLYDNRLSTQEAKTLYTSWLLQKMPQKGAYILMGGTVLFSPDLPQITTARKIRISSLPEISDYPIYSTDDAVVSAAGIREFLIRRQIPRALVCASDGKQVLVCSKKDISPILDNITANPLTFPDILTDVLTEKEAADLLQISEKDLKKQRETGEIPRNIFKPSGKTALYLKSAFLAKAQSVSENKTPEDAGNIRDFLPLLLVFTPPEAAPIWHRPSEEIRSAAAGAGHRAARLGPGETRTAGRQHLVTYDALTSLFGPPDPIEWQNFVSPFISEN